MNISNMRKVLNTFPLQERLTRGLNKEIKLLDTSSYLNGMRAFRCINSFINIQNDRDFINSEGFKVLSVVGARPNYIKLAAIHDSFRIFNHVIIDTGQHYDYEMNKIFFNQFSIPEPHCFLGVGSGSHGYQIGEMVKRIEEVLSREKPDIVVIYGDTNSSLAAAIAAAKAGFKVAHVEAGLRSFDMSMPEEINRRVIDHISSLLFAPIYSAAKNLEKESAVGEICLTGDVHVDLFNKYQRVIKERAKTMVDKFDLSENGYVVVTIHRAENTDNISRLRKIVEILLQISEYIMIFFPIHPRTEKVLKNTGLFSVLAESSEIIVSKPLGYIDFLSILTKAKIVLTDSGGVQREAYLLNKPCGVFRDRSEWVELIENGYVTLLDVDVFKVLRFIQETYSVEVKPGLLGDGKAGKRIASIILTYLSKK